MEKQNRTRAKRVIVSFTDEEYQIARARMLESGGKAFEKYMRSLATGGAIYKVDTAEIKAHTLALNAIGKNINQIAKKANEYRINQTDIAEVKALMQELVDGEKAIIQMAIDIHRLRG